MQLRVDEGAKSLRPQKETGPCKEVQALYARNRLKFGEKSCMLLRDKSVTATDLSVIVGANPYMNEMILLRRKFGLDKFEGNEATRHGERYEKEALLTYEAVTGNKLMEEALGFVRGVPERKDLNFVGCTPDAVLKYRPVLVEIKCPFFNNLFDTKEKHVPAIYYPQVQCQLAVTGFRECHFVQYRPASIVAVAAMDVTVVNFDNEWWEKMAVPHIFRFYEVMTFAPPPPKLIRQDAIVSCSRKRKSSALVDLDASETAHI
jgi:putative phage-type endonuclease